MSDAAVDAMIASWDRGEADLSDSIRRVLLSAPERALLAEHDLSPADIVSGRFPIVLEPAVNRMLRAWNDRLGRTVFMPFELDAMIDSIESGLDADCPDGRGDRLRATEPAAMTATPTSLIEAAASWRRACEARATCVTHLRAQAARRIPESLWVELEQAEALMRGAETAIDAALDALPDGNPSASALETALRLRRRVRDELYALAERDQTTGETDVARFAELGGAMDDAADAVDAALDAARAGLLEPDYSEIRMVPDAVRAVWEPRPPRLTPARRAEIERIVAAYRQRRHGAEAEAPEQPQDSDQ